jgi:replicative DNA helicase
MTDKLNTFFDVALPEWQVIGIIMQEPRLRGKTSFLTGKDFIDYEAGAIFDAIIDLADAGKPVSDLAFLIPELKAMGKLTGETARAVRRAAEHAITSNLIFYAEQIRNSAALRELVIVGGQLSQDATAAGADPNDVRQRHEARLSAIGYGTDVAQVKSAGEVADEVLSDLRSPQPRRCIYTGLSSVDSAIGGWHAGELIVLAARPGCGKTAFALQVATHNAHAERGVFFVTLEMKDRELIKRVLSSESGVDGRLLRTRTTNDSDMQLLEAAANELRATPFHLFDPARVTTKQIRGAAKHQAAKSGLSLLVVDYIGLVRPDDPKKPRHEQVAAVTADLKSLAKELAIPVLALCQLNREADGQVPALSMLRESGAIEQDADLVLFLHRDQNDLGNVLFIVAKHRHGDTGQLKLGWDGPTTRFIDPNEFRDFK